LVSFAASVSKEKPSLDLSKGKSTIKGGKKKRKEILQKADAAGTTSDLYNTYKGPEEKKETVVSTDSTESTSNSADVKQAPADAGEVDAIASEKGAMSKAEPDDWEDTANVSTPKLEVSDNGQQVIGRPDNHDNDEEVITAKKYSRDFLLKFAEQYNDLPKAFQITSFTETLMSANFNISHQASFAASVSKDKPSLDLSKGKSTIKGGKKKIKKIASPQTPLLMVHKAKKYEVGKVVDEEDAKQRQLRAILNKLTPTKFEKLFEQVKAVNIDNAATLTGVVS
jgi:hypothetical protein